MRGGAWRASVARLANESARLCAASVAGNPAPTLREGSGVSTLLAWLRWNDPNGEYLEDGQELDADTDTMLWELIEDQVAE